MTIEDWLQVAAADAGRRNIPGLVPALQNLAKVTAALRAADWNRSADGPTPVIEQAPKVPGARADR